MNVKGAVEDAKKLDEVEEILEGGGYFCSAFITLDKGEEIEEWNLGFYSSEKDEITAVKVTNQGAETGVTDEPLRDVTHEMEIKKIKTDADEALERAREELDENYEKDYSRIFLSLKKQNGNQEWSVVFIAVDGTLISVEVTTETGEIIASEESSLIQSQKSVGG